MSENKKRFLAAEVGKTVKGLPYAFHLEGYISRDGYFRAAEDDKVAYFGTAIGITHSPEALMKQANDGEFAPDEDGFVTLALFGKQAEEFSKICVVGLHVAVSGRMEWHDYKNSAGNDARDLRILVDQFVVMGGRNNDPVISPTVGVQTLVFTGRDGVIRHTNNACLLTGTVIGAKGLKQSGNNNPYLPFGLKTKMSAEKVEALVNGTYDKNVTYDNRKTIINCTVFGKRAETLAKFIRDGAELVVTGPVDSRQYNGNTYIQMRPRVTSIMKFAPLSDTQSASPEAAPAYQLPPEGSIGAAAQAQGGYSDNYSDFIPMDGDDDDLPF